MRKYSNLLKAIYIFVIRYSYSLQLNNFAISFFLPAQYMYAT